MIQPPRRDHPGAIQHQKYITMTIPHITAVLAMSADGKISDAGRSGMHLGSSVDRAHLEAQVAAVDGVLMGAGTLRSEGAAMGVYADRLLAERTARGQSPQPVQIICSASGHLDPNWRFFRQALPRWLLTTVDGAKYWGDRPGFDRVVVVPPIHHDLIDFAGQVGTIKPDPTPNVASPVGTSATRGASRSTGGRGAIAWSVALPLLRQAGLRRLALLGGGTLVSSIAAAGALQELWLTVCPILVGGGRSPTPCDGDGFLTQVAPRLQLLNCQVVGQEVFLHYRVQNHHHAMSYEL